MKGSEAGLNMCNVGVLMGCRLHSARTDCISPFVYSVCAETTHSDFLLHIMTFLRNLDSYHDYMNLMKSRFIPRLYEFNEI